MKRGMSVLVLLLALAFAATVVLPPAVSASVHGGPLLAEHSPDAGNQVVDVNSASDDGSDGDPGDAGDGYGATDDRYSLDPQGTDGVDWDWQQVLHLILLVLRIAG